MKTCLLCNFRSERLEVMGKRLFDMHRDAVFIDEMKKLVNQQVCEFIDVHPRQPVYHDRDKLLVEALGCKDPSTVM